MLRLVLRRESGTIGMTNLFVVVLIADAAQNAMANDYRSVPDGLVLVATILFWSHVLGIGTTMPGCKPLEAYAI